MGSPQPTSRVRFVETADDSEAEQPNFNNAVLEIADLEAGSGLGRLLAEATGGER